MFGAIIAVALFFMWTSVRTFKRISRFRASPAWCQEVLIRGESKAR